MPREEDFQSDAFMANQPPGMKCKSTIVTNTRTEYVADMNCTGAQPMTGRVSIQASSNAAFKGTDADDEHRTRRDEHEHGDDWQVVVG